MADDEVTATASPQSEPIVAPQVALIEQFAVPLAPVFMRTPRNAEGKPIAGESELDKAVNAKDDTWQRSGCHPTSISMMVKWYVETNPETSPKIAIPNRTEDEKKMPVTPLLVAKWLWDAEGNPNQLRFVSMKDRPPFVPHRPDFKVDHDALTASCEAITLDGAPMKVVRQGLAKCTPDALPGLKAERAKLQKSLADVEKKRAAKKAQIEQATDKNRPALEAELKKLDKEKAKIEAKLASNVVDDEGKLDEKKANASRQIKKEKIKKALLRGPVLLNMTMPGHYVVAFGYRGRNLFICDPGKSIFNSWIKKQTDKSGAAKIANSPDILRLDAEKPFVLPVPGVKAKKGESVPTFEACFLDCLINFESYYFESLGDHAEWNRTAEPAAAPFT